MSQINIRTFKWLKWQNIFTNKMLGELPNSLAPFTCEYSPLFGDNLLRSWSSKVIVHEVTCIVQCFQIVGETLQKKSTRISTLFCISFFPALHPPVLFFVILLFPFTFAAVCGSALPGFSIWQFSTVHFFFLAFCFSLCYCLCFYSDMHPTMSWLIARRITISSPFLPLHLALLYYLGQWCSLCFVSLQSILPVSFPL